MEEGSTREPEEHTLRLWKIQPAPERGARTGLPGLGPRLGLQKTAGHTPRRPVL